jgi:hypothetical protein
MTWLSAMLMKEEPPRTLRVLWPEFEKKAWGLLTQRESGLAMAAGIGIWLVWASTGPVVRPSTGLLVRRV